MYPKLARLVLSALLVSLFWPFPESSASAFEPVINPQLETTRATGDVHIDGKLDEAAWSGAARAGNFVERFPGDNLEGEAAWAYEFCVNPYGVQKDMLWTKTHGEDAGFDLVWSSAAHVNDSGYTVEIAVPFASLRFPNRDVQTWRVDFQRNHPRESYRVFSWSANTHDEQCWPCQWGTVNGITGVCARARDSRSSPRSSPHRPERWPDCARCPLRRSTRTPRSPTATCSGRRRSAPSTRSTPTSPSKAPTIRTSARSRPMRLRST